MTKKLGDRAACSTSALCVRAESPSRSVNPITPLRDGMRIGVAVGAVIWCENMLAPSAKNGLSNEQFTNISNTCNKDSLLYAGHQNPVVLLVVLK